MCVAHFFPRRFFFLGKTLRNTNGQTTGGECGDIARDREKPKYLDRKFVTKWQMLLRLLVLFSLLFCLFLFCGAHFFHFLPRRWPKKLKKVSAFLPVRYINIYILCSDPFRWPYIYMSFSEQLLLFVFGFCFIWLPAVFAIFYITTPFIISLGQNTLPHQLSRPHKGSHSFLYVFAYLEHFWHYLPRLQQVNKTILMRL